MPVRVDMNRRQFVRLIGGVAFATLAPASLYAQPDRTVTVYKEATCGCCGGWARHMTKAGFAVTAVDVSNIGALKTMHGIPDTLATCHTAEVEAIWSRDTFRRSWSSASCANAPKRKA
jgi:hypothetical protein